MDALYFRVSSDRQTAQNQFEDLLQVAEKDGFARDWDKIRQALADCIYEEQLTGNDGAARTVYRLRAEVVPAYLPSSAYTWSKENPVSAALDRGRRTGQARWRLAPI